MSDDDTPDTPNRNKWMDRALAAAVSCILTGGSLYATQYAAFLKDSPTRKEVSDSIDKAMQNTPYVRERDLIRKTLENIESQQRDNHVALLAMQKSLGEMNALVARLDERLPHQAGKRGTP
jgi:hypothetical protein